ncbi:MAG: zeta toxin family protein, partial [Pseudomonadota bacterium]|nr:zeta toxin family protein [Pseudomonadota bacterium]
GQAWGTRDFIISVAADLAANAYCGEAIGGALGDMLSSAVAQGGYRQLPSQERPIVINTKGASAAGKSTLRPLQQRLAREIGVGWEDFALISPDIWRKQLLDYEALGPAYKYAGALSADELQIIDHKLDRYMARKNQSGKMSHLLIDRFRFDSFAPASDEAGSNLLTRFGQTVFMFFVITPPESLIERAWNRGLEFGRYKAVDDTLAHAVEAYSGIPNVFFTWIRRSDKSIRFEFLDNAVPLGEPPWTVAFGDNTTCNVLDIQNLLNIVRFGRIDVNATSAAGLYPDRELLRGPLNVEFLRRCIAEFQHVNFAEQITGKVFLQIESGKPVWKDSTTMQAVLSNQDTRAALDSVASPPLVALAAEATDARYLRSATHAAQTPSLGRWGRSN